MPRERWLPAPGLEGSYEVSDLGNVRSAKTGRQRALRFDSQGYLCFSAQRGAKIDTPRVHRLVCRAFHGPKPSSAHLVAHFDGNPQNNRAENLRWATQAENMQDAARHGTCYGKGSKIDEATARQIIARMNNGRRQCDIVREFGVDRHLVYNIRRGISWSNLQHLVA